MIDQAVKRLEELARTDQSVARLAVLQAEARSASADPSWEAGVPTFDRRRAEEGFPLLHRQTLGVDRRQAADLLDRLASAGERAGVPALAALRRALRAGDVDPPSLLAAGICQDGDFFSSLADRIDAEAEPLAAFGQVAVVPLLQACGRRAAPLLDGLNWEPGYCPLCAAWVTIAELRGLERQRWFRCGRCGAGWLVRNHLRCAFCGTTDHRAQGYLAPEADRESRRAVTCDQCHGYLKTVTTVGAIPAAEIAFHDLTTLELDVAALEREYGRPRERGFPLELEVVASERRNGWQVWRR